MKYAKFMPGRNLSHASRNRRELEVAKDCGFEVEVISSDDEAYFKEHFPQYSLVSDGSVKVSYSMSWIKRHWQIFIGKFKVLKVARHIDADVVSCHDLDSLWNCWLANSFKSHRPKMVYDSHEFELGRNKKRSRLGLWWVKKQERFLMKRCVFSIMVNDVIADEVQRIHGLKQRPVVVRNIPSYWNIDKEECSKMKTELLSMMSSPRKTMLMYHGGVASGRGIETLLMTVSKNDDVCLVVLGNAEHGYLDKLVKMTKALGIDDRVLFHQAVSIAELWKYVGASDIGMVTIPAIAKSYYYMLPNKFFENIQCETPVICSNYPAIQPLVEKYGVGLTCDPTDVEAINACIHKFISDEQFFDQCKQNAKIAKEELCWEKESLILKKAFTFYLS